MTRPVRVGAVMYDPKVSTIWNIIQQFFEERGCPIDVEFYNSYARQVTALLAGDLDVAWNSPLAWVDSQRRSNGACRAIAMRDTDRDRVSHLVVRADSPLVAVGDLRGRTVALGAQDSPQATLIPMGLLRRGGLEPERDYQPMRFDVLVGKHGDHIGGELEAFRALERGDADATAMLDLNWTTWTQDGTINPAKYRLLATTGRFDHCVFTAHPAFGPADEARWREALFAMRYDNPAHREMMDLEGLKAWLPGRTTGFAALQEAVEAFRYFDTPEPQ